MKLNLNKFHLQIDYRKPSGFDRTRNVEIGNKNIKLEHLEEAYTTEHWLVRVYKVKKPANRPKISYVERKVKSKYIFATKKVRSLRKNQN